MTKLEKQVEALRDRMGTCRIEDFHIVREEFFRMEKKAAEKKCKKAEKICACENPFQDPTTTNAVCGFCHKPLRNYAKQ